MSLSAVVVTKPFDRAPSIPMGPLLPFQGSFHPFVDEADGENHEKQHHRQESRQADVVDHGRPREEKRDLEVEQDEQDRRKIFCEHKVLVPTSRLELLRLFRPLAPQASVSTNFTTWANAKLSPKNHRGTSL